MRKGAVWIQEKTRGLQHGPGRIAGEARARQQTKCDRLSNAARAGARAPTFGL